MKRIFTISVVMILALTLAAQSNYSPCYTNNMSKGNTAFSQGKYSEARTYYANAKQCAGGDPAEAQKKIAACDAKIKEHNSIINEQTDMCSIEPKSAISVYSQNGHVLYAGVTNKLYFSAPSVTSQYVVRIPDCMVKRNAAGEMVVDIPESLERKRITATVMTSPKDGSKTLYSVEFYVKPVPNPQAVVGAAIRGGKRSKAELTTNPLVRASVGDNFAYDIKWTVNSYKVVFISKGYEESPLTCIGAVFSEELKQKIEKADSGTVIVFTGISVSYGNITRTLDEISVRIK